MSACCGTSYTVYLYSISHCPSELYSDESYSCERHTIGRCHRCRGPAFAESISEGDIRWIKQKGDFVKEDELVAEIETDKTSVEVPAPQSGTIVELLVEDGAKVTAKQKLYKLELDQLEPVLLLLHLHLRRNHRKKLRSQHHVHLQPLMLRQLQFLHHRRHHHHPQQLVFMVIFLKLPHRCRGLHLHQCHQFLW